MKKRTRKLIAPIVIAVLLIAYLCAFVVLWTLIPVPTVIRVLGIVIPLGLVGVSIFVLIERIKEIRSGEEDDIGQY